MAELFVLPSLFNGSIVNVDVIFARVIICLLLTVFSQIGLKSFSSKPKYSECLYNPEIGFLRLLFVIKFNFSKLFVVLVVRNSYASE